MTTPRSRSSSWASSLRARHEIAQQVDRLGRRLRAHGDVEGDQVVAGVGVQHAPETLGGLVDVLVGRVLLAALEDEVLEEVRHPVLLDALAARPGVEGHQDRQCARAREPQAVHRQPVICNLCRGYGGHRRASIYRPSAQIAVHGPLGAPHFGLVEFQWPRSRLLGHRRIPREGCSGRSGAVAIALLLAGTTRFAATQLATPLLSFCEGRQFYPLPICKSQCKLPGTGRGTTSPIGSCRLAGGTQRPRRVVHGMNPP